MEFYGATNEATIPAEPFAMSRIYTFHLCVSKILLPRLYLYRHDDTLLIGKTTRKLLPLLQKLRLLKETIDQVKISRK